MASVYSLVYQPSESVYAEPYHYNRVRIGEVKLIAGHGIEGDLKAGHNPNRQLNVMSYEALETLRAEGFRTDPGELGEQIILQGLDVRTLEPGDRLQLGDSAVVEFVKLRTGCDWFELVQGKPREQAAGRIGMMARVIVGGQVREGDAVTVLERLTEQSS